MNNAEFHEVNQTKIVLINLDNPVDVKLKTNDQRRFKLKTSQVEAFKDPLLENITFVGNGETDDYLLIDSNSLVLVSIPINDDISVGMVDFRHLQPEGKPPVPHLLPMGHTIDHVLQILTKRSSVLKETDVILFNELSALMGVY